MTAAPATVRPATAPTGWQWRAWLPAIAGLGLFAVALEVLRAALRTVGWAGLMADVARVPGPVLALVVGLTALNYIVLSGYDLLALRSIGRTLPRARVMAISFLAYAIANNISLAIVSGASVRYRFYTRHGITGEELSRIVVSYSVTFWLGLCALGGLSLVVTPLPLVPELPGRAAVDMAGSMLLLLPCAYLIATACRRRPFRLWKLTVTLPAPAIGFAQLALSVIDWTLASAVLYTLLPSDAPPFMAFTGVFLMSVLLGIASHVPGGLGVFEGLMVLLLKPSMASTALLPALVVYRAVYYLLPLAVALLALVVDELHQRREQLKRVGGAIARFGGHATPHMLATCTFVAGFVLLASGSTPAVPGRLMMLARVLPLDLIEVSHFIASVAGAGLLVLSQGLARRLDGACHVTAALLVLGIATTLLKGFDVEEAAWLAVVLCLLYRARPAFYRRAAFFETRFTPGWCVCVVGALGASVWLGLFTYQHVDYSRDLWWQFELRRDASRFLRASVGAAVVLLTVALRWLLGYAPHQVEPPTEADLRDAARAIATQAATFPNVAFLRDKALLFDDERTAFIMYGVQGRTWAALGDPVGPTEKHDELIHRFLERCRDVGGVPAFYEVTPLHLHRYADVGLTFVKLGEEAKVDLRTFSLQGSSGATFRQAVHRLEREHGTFRVIDPSCVPSILPELRAVSDDWLVQKAAAEKGFSLGYFDESYLRRFPVAVIERHNRIEAFANIWPGAGGAELSVDLMRHRRDAPPGVMEALFVHVMLWGQSQGYVWFSLGMAPLSGVEQSPVASVWNRVGAFVYEHGKALYNFRGLRAYKEKFNPVWEPRYLACPGGLQWPRILADVSALVAGGYRHVIMK